MTFGRLLLLLGVPALAYCHARMARGKLRATGWPAFTAPSSLYCVHDLHAATMLSRRRDPLVARVRAVGRLRVGQGGGEAAGSGGRHVNRVSTNMIRPTLRAPVQEEGGRTSDVRGWMRHSVPLKQTSCPPKDLYRHPVSRQPVCIQSFYVHFLDNLPTFSPSTSTF